VSDESFGTALVAIGARDEQAHRFRPSAPIVAQLMAVRLDAPQTRARRRAADAEGVAAYGATGEKVRLGKRQPGPSWAA
jgi:hypothetical protein